MYRIVSVTDNSGNLKIDFMNKLKAEHPLLEGEILNKNLLQSNVFLDNLRFQWNDDTGKVLSTSYVVDCKKIGDRIIASTMNSIYTLEFVRDK